MNDAIEKFYDVHVQDEDKRLDYHAFELPVTLHHIHQYLQKGSKILDVACGTGRYAVHLLRDGYQLGLNDISKKNMRLTKERVGQHHNVLYLDQEDALQTTLWEKEKWDGILILGPLYHFINFSKRLALLQKAKKYIRPGGYIFSAFMSRSGALIFGMLHNPEGILKEKGANYLWKYGTDEHFIEATETFEHAHVYFAQPDEINPLIKKAGLIPEKLIGIEGIFGERFDAYHQMSNDLQHAWMKFIIDHGEDIPMIYQSKHLLSVARV